MADEQIVTSIVAKADLSSLVSEVHRATTSLQQLQRELVTSNKAIASATKVANNSFRDTLVGSGLYSSHFVNLHSDVDKFGKQLDAGRLKLKDYFQTFRTHATTQKGLIRELAKEQVMLQNAVLQPLGRNAQGLMQYNVHIPRGLDAVKNSTQLARMEMQIMNRALLEGSTSLINWGKNTQWAGRQLTVGLTVPLAMFGSQAAKAFREADQELTRLVKVYGDISGTASSDLAKIRKDVTDTAKELSSAMGVSFKETIGLAADIAATGQQGEQLLGSLKETTRLAVLGEVDRAEAMKATLAIQTAFKSNTEELTQSINFLNAVENQTSTTLNDLVEAIPKAGTVVKQLGGDVQDLALYLTAMREGGVNASESANALKSGLASMINPTKQTIAVMSEFGIDIMGMVEKNTGNTTGMITDLQKALDSLDPLSKARALEQMFGKFQFARMAALFNNLGKEGSQTLQVMDLMNASAEQLANIAGRELELVTESASGKYRRAIEGLRASLAEVGEDFLSVATKFINAFTKVLDFFNNLPEPIRKAVTYLGGFTAVIGPIIMLTGVLANFFGYITKGIVQLRAFFQRAAGWKMLTPEMIAAEKAAQMVEKSFYEDAAAAEVLHGALQKLILDYNALQKAMLTGSIPVNPALSTVTGSTITSPLRRIVDPNDPLVGEENTRAISHINPRDRNNPATWLGGVPGAIPVNQKIGANPQIYMKDKLPDVPGLTTIKGVSTGIVAGEAARYHALLASLAMQTEAEVASLKKTISLGGTVSSDLLQTFDDILPLTSSVADNAATQSAAIVAQLRAGKLSVEQARAEIMAINAAMEAQLQRDLAVFAASRGRTIDFTKAPLMNQPVTDANAQFTLRDLYKKEGNRAVMEEFGRLRGVRTHGAPYSIHVTRVPKFNTGGPIESFGPSKTVVSGPTSINYDDRLGKIPLGGYVVNQAASMDPNNQWIRDIAPSTYSSSGPTITAELTPGEIVLGPNLQKDPATWAAVDAANNGYNLGGQIMKGINNYGKKLSPKEQAAKKRKDFLKYRQSMKDYAKFITNPRYADDIRVRMIMLDAAELMEYGKFSPNQAINIAASNFDRARLKSGGSLNSFIEERIKQVQGLEKKFPNLKHPDSSATRVPNSSALNLHLNKVREAMLGSSKFKNVYDLIEAVPRTFSSTMGGIPSIKDAGVVRGHILRHGDVGYATRGHMGVAAVIPHNINDLLAKLDMKGFMTDIVHLDSDNARKAFDSLIKRTGLSGLTTFEDIAAALIDEKPGKFLSKEEISSGVIRSTAKQRKDLQMLMQAVMEKKRWRLIPRGRPPIPTMVLSNFNAGGPVMGSRKSYGNPMSLLSPDKMLRILANTKQIAGDTAKSSFGKMPVANYSHMISPSSGKSYPIPGVSGLYKNENGELVFFKGVPNEISAKAEMYGTRMAREVFGLNSPIQTIKTIKNPYDPSGKSKLLGLESPFDPKIAVGGTKFTEDQMIRQTIASLLMNNKDLSKSNVFGNVLADVGPAGVFPRASMNTAFASSMNSMEKQALINLLAVRGGARKDFARNTSSTVSKMTPRKYGSKMKAAMKGMHPKLKAFIETLPKEDRAPYIAMLARLEDGMKVNWSKYQPIHANPKFNRGGMIGGGRITSGRTAYGRPGNPANRAEWERKQAERAAKNRAIEESKRRQHSGFGSKAIYTGALGRDAFSPIDTGGTMTRQIGGFYDPGSQLRSGFLPNITMPANIPFVGNTAAIANVVQNSFKSMIVTIKEGANALALNSLASAKYAADAMKTAGLSMLGGVKSYVTDARHLANVVGQKIYHSPFLSNVRLEAYQRHREAGTLDKYKPGMMTGPIGLTPWQQQTLQDGRKLETRKQGFYGFRRSEYRLDGQTISRAEAQKQGLVAPRGQMGMGAQMGIGMAGMAAGSALMSQGKMGLGMGVMLGSSIAPMLMPQIASGLGKVKDAAKNAATAFKSGTSPVKAFVTALTSLKAAGPLLAITAIVAAIGFLIKKTRDWNKDAQLRFGMNEKAAEQAGIEYTSLADKIDLVIQKQSQLKSLGRIGGISGLNMSLQELKDSKKFAQENLTEFIASFNRANKENIGQLAANIKAQFVAAGMSVEEANKKIMGIVAASKNANLAVNLLSDKGFAKIKDQASAAEFSVQNLVDVIENGNSATDQYKTSVIEGISSVITTMDASIESISKQKDAFGNVNGEAKALEVTMERMSKIQGFNISVGQEAFSKMPAELQQIAAASDSVAGIYAKWRLLLKGVNVDLKNISSETALAIDKYLTGFSAAIDKLEQMGRIGKGSATTIGNTFGAVGFAISKLQAIIDKTNEANQKAAVKAQRAAEDQNKLIEKQIKLINDAAKAKLDALEATQAKESYELAIKKEQLEYQNALATGDMAAAARAQINITQLTKERQIALAKQAIEDERARKEEEWRKKQEKLQEDEAKRQRVIADAQMEAAEAQKAIQKIEEFRNTYKDLLLQQEANQFISDGVERRRSISSTNTAIQNVVKDIQKQGLSGGFMGDQIKGAFSQFFDSKTGKALTFDTITQSPVYDKNTGLRLESQFRAGNITGALNRDLAAVQAQAKMITGGMTIKQLAESISRDLKDPKSKKMNPELYSRSGFNNSGQMDPFAPAGGTLVKQNGKTYVYDHQGIPHDITTPRGLKVIEALRVDTSKAPLQLYKGGPVSGPGTSTSDSIPALLSDGEFVVNAASAKKFGYDNLETVNRMAKGGIVGKYNKGGKIAEKFKPGTSDAMIAAAESMIGYKEKGNNDTLFGKFAQNLYSLGTRFIAWCGAFINWAANKSGVKLSSMLWTPAGAESFQKTGAWTKTNPKRGDLAFFDFPGDGVNRISHVGLVKDVLSKTMVRTIEGNTSSGMSGNQRDGQGVFARTRGYNYRGASIVGFGRPQYKNSPSDPNSKKVENYVDSSGKVRNSHIQELMSYAAIVDPRIMMQLAYGGRVRKFHDLNGTVPGPYGSEVAAILKAGTEGVYSTNYINHLKNGTMKNSSGQTIVIGEIAPVINVPEGMDARQVANLAADAVFNKIKTTNVKIGESRSY